MNRTEFKQVLIEVCHSHYITLQSLADLVRRQPESLRDIEEDQQIATEWLWSYSNRRPSMGNGGIALAQKLKMDA